MALNEIRKWRINQLININIKWIIKELKNSISLRYSNKIIRIKLIGKEKYLSRSSSRNSN
jgi:ribosomal protein L28